MNDNAVKVGDELAFRTNYGTRVEIHRVERFTPKGQVVCGPYRLTPGLSVIGGNSYSGPSFARLATSEDRDKVTLQRSSELAEEWMRTPKGRVSQTIREAVDNAIAEALKAKEQA